MTMRSPDGLAAKRCASPNPVKLLPQTAAFRLSAATLHMQGHLIHTSMLLPSSRAS